MDPFTVAAALVGILVPLLRSAGEAASEHVARKAGEAMGDAAVRGAGSLWRKLVPTLREQPDAKRAIEDLSRDPDLNSAQAVLGGRIAFVLDADGDLLREAAAVVDARDRYVASNIKVRGNQNAVALGNDNIVIASSRDVRIRGGGRGSPGAR